MADVDPRVGKNIKRALRDSETDRLEAGSTDELKEQVGAGGMRTLHFQQLLAALKHQRVIRGFSLGGDNVYIQA